MKMLFQFVSCGLGLLFLGGVIGGCTSPSLIQSTQPGASVRWVDFTETPELNDWAERAQRLGDELYPRLLALLASDSAKPTQGINIVFKKRLSGDNRGAASGRTVYINAAYFAPVTNGNWSYTQAPENFEKVFVHEMAHVAEDRSFRPYSKKSPGYWSEGIADYARYKLGYTNGWSCPKCDDDYPHYTSGYSCAGAFLLYVEAHSSSEVIRQLASALRHGSYSDDLFIRTTGKSLDDWWADFRKTPAYRAGAAEAFRLQQALGYANGIPPKNMGARAISYLRRKPGGRLTLESGRFISQLMQQNRLPGATEAERQGKHFTLGLDAADLLSGSESVDFPAMRKWFGHYEGDASRNCYVVFRPSKDQPWELQRAWRADADGNVLKDYPLQ